MMAGEKSLSARELGHYSFVTGLRGSHFNHLADMALKKIGLASYKIAMELQESTAAKEFVRHGVNIACLPRCTVVKELTARTLVELKPSTPLQDLELRCGYAGPLSENATRFLACLKSTDGN
jgi:DNA-binding transcriptional LysR family regulator